MIGQRLLHYQVLEKLGEGGMGVVYKARDTHLDRYVAIKVLPPEKVSDPDRKARFIREAKAASALNHPNIITIHDITNDNGTDFIAMEFVDGKTLDQLIPRKGMRLNEALRIAIQIADALARAHEAGIIHRDLKPANIMVDAHGHVKLLDFGLAKLTERLLGEDESTATAALQTDEDTIVGTAAYMSPEQAEGKPPDPRSDIFSFGSVLYEMLTRRRAFQADSRMAALAAVMHQEPPALPDAMPPELRRMIMRCLRKDPARRYHHMEDLRVVLDDLKEDSDSGISSSGSPGVPAHNRQLRAAGALITLGLLSSAAFWMWTSIRDAGTASVARPVPLTTHSGDEVDPTLSPDGSQVAYSWNGPNEENYDIYVQTLDSAEPLRLTDHPAKDSRPAWSPDGKWVSYIRSGPEGYDVMKMTPLGKEQRRLARLPQGPYPYQEYPPAVSWTPDSRFLVISECGEPACSLFLLPATGGERLRLTTPPDGSYADYHPVISSGGSELAFTRYLEGGIRGTAHGASQREFSAGRSCGQGLDCPLLGPPCVDSWQPGIAVFVAIPDLACSRRRRQPAPVGLRGRLRRLFESCHDKGW